MSHVVSRLLTFKKLSNLIVNNKQRRFEAYGCSELEELVLLSFLNYYSGIYRIDSYGDRIPPFVLSLNNILDSALNKLPCSGDDLLYRACTFGDKEDFSVGEIFAPCYSLTTSADSSWEDKSENRYIISIKTNGTSRARAIYKAYNKANEFQVSFLSNTEFVVTDLQPWGINKKAIFLKEV